MKRRTLSLLLAIAFLTGMAGTASAQLRFDIDIMMPFSINIVQDLTNLSETESEQIPITVPIPFPNIQALLQAELGALRLGGGLRAFTFIVDSVIYPVLFGELKLGPLAVNANIGGVAFLFFGLITKVTTGDSFHFTTNKAITLGDLNVGWCLTDWFRVEVGAFGFLLLDQEGITGTPWGGVLYGGVKFTLEPDKKR